MAMNEHSFLSLKVFVKDGYIEWFNGWYRFNGNFMVNKMVVEILHLLKWILRYKSLRYICTYM